ncbi:MAG: Two component regulator three Y domain-containing protein [Bacteroidota bacterium]
MVRPTKIAILFILLGVLVSGQNLLPPVNNYSLLEYKGASKNWDLTTNADGELFVANNMGLLHFNGEQWQLYKLPNNTIIRSVLSLHDRVYTGSYEEFGFWEKNENGSLEYNSLTHLIRDHEFTSEEFWEILPFQETIIFRSFSAIYVYANNTIKVIDPPQVVSDFIEFNGRLFVATGRDGLFELKGNMLEPIQEPTLLEQKTLTDMTVVEGTLFIGSKLQGCFIFNGEDVVPWENPLNEELKLHQLTKVMYLGDGKLAFGTIKNGVYLFDSKTGTSQSINKNGGLQNNTVLSLLLYEDQLWLGLDNGIARLKLDNPITYYTDYSGVLGTVYDIAFYDNTLYLGSNTGVFYFDDSGLNFVDGSQGHVWDLLTMDEDLICGHNTGTYRVSTESFEKIATVSGGYQIVKVPEQNSLYVQGTYYGLATYKRASDGNWEATRIMGLSFPVKQLCFEDQKTLWVAHPYKGFYRVHLDSDYSNVLRIEAFNDESLPSVYNVKIYRIKNQIVLYSQGNWFKYDAILGEIVPFAEFQSFKDHELLNHKNDHLWFVENEGKDVIRTNFREDSLLISDLSLRKRLVPDSQRMIKTNDSIAYVTLSDGFARVNIAKLRRQLGSNRLPVPKLTFIQDKFDSVSPVSIAHSFSFKRSRILEIGFATPKLIQPRYGYVLTGPEHHKGYVEGGSVTFQNLSWGDYTFEVTTVGVDNKISDTTRFSFTIAPPWFLSTISLLFYLLLVAIVVFLVRKYNRNKLNRKQRELEQQMQKEQDKRMAQLEREKLEKEVKLKQNEVASTALNIARKNEMILEFKNLLVLNKDKFPNTQRYRSFMRKLNNAVQDTEDWKRFELSFKELHEDFFERLLAEYPVLTPKDLKLCAYLKMNFSSKEIAPLMGITIRGVEIHRYRLRKKLRLESTKNLSKFLITFS